jgi:hypothetical protein
VHAARRIGIRIVRHEQRYLVAVKQIVEVQNRTLQLVSGSTVGLSGA